VHWSTKNGRNRQSPAKNHNFTQQQISTLHQKPHGVKKFTCFQLPYISKIFIAPLKKYLCSFFWFGIKISLGQNCLHLLGYTSILHTFLWAAVYNLHTMSWNNFLEFFPRIPFSPDYNWKHRIFMPNNNNQTNHKACNQQAYLLSKYTESEWDYFTACSVLHVLSTSINYNMYNLLKSWCRWCGNVDQIKAQNIGQLQ